jgi:hypothetical protein
MDLKLTTPTGSITLQSSFGGMLGPRILVTVEGTEELKPGKPIQLSLQNSQARQAVVLLTNYLLGVGKQEVAAARSSAIDVPDAGPQAASEIE